MMKIFKSKIFWALGIVFIIGTASLVYFFISSQKVSYITEPVVKGTVYQTVSATGKVEPISEVNLSFKTAGRLDILNVKVGDQITAGQVLAQLRLSDFTSDVARAEADLQEANANLSKSISGYTQEDINISQAEVAKAQTALKNAGDDLSATEQLYQQALLNAQQNLLTNLRSAINKASISRQKINDTLLYKGSADYFNTTDPSLENKVSSGYVNSGFQLTVADSAVAVAQASVSPENVDIAYLATLDFLNMVQTVLSDLSNLLNYVTTNNNLTVAELNTLKSNIATELTTIDSSITTVQNSQQTLINARIELQTEITAAKNAVTTAEKSLARAQADLALKTSPTRPEDLDLARAKVARAQAVLSSAQQELSDATLRSLQPGVVTAVNYEVGEQVSISTPVIELATDNNFEIEVDIPESDIAKIEVGDSVNVTLDAFTDDDIFSATVISINPTETEIQDVVYFKVTVVLDSNQAMAIEQLASKIKPGMTANITIKTDEVTDVLVIPYRAIKEVAGQRVVDILENGTVRSVSVVIGLRGDEGEVEVVSGLSAGQQVITFVNQP